MEAGFWAIGVEYEAGESIKVEVHGNSPLLKGGFVPDDPFLGLTSKRTHWVHIGGEYPSYVVLPFV